jgi:hypothetical protein
MGLDVPGVEESAKEQQSGETLVEEVLSEGFKSYREEQGVSMSL